MTPPRRTPTAADQLDLLASNPTPHLAAQPRALRMGAVEAELWTADLPTPPALIGLDEAGRGPLAGPVSVAAVALHPRALRDAPRSPWIDALDDSKKLSEARRDALLPHILLDARAWAVAHVHADHIDRVNILQATFHGMALAAEALLGSLTTPPWTLQPSPLDLRRVEDDTAVEPAWYAEDLRVDQPPRGAHLLASTRTLDDVPDDDPAALLLLIDGNATLHIPGAPAAALRQRAVVKGDALSFHIAAASILAKVTRDQIMARAEDLWPGYGLAGHKGYPTAAHKQAIAALGASPFHRRSFAGVAPSAA